MTPAPVPEPKKRRGRKKKTADAVPISVTDADLAAWRSANATAWVYSTPLPAPRTVDLVVSAEAAGDTDGQFGYQNSRGADDAGVVRVTFEDGRFVDVSGTGVIGRDPSATRIEGVQHIITLPDPTRELSREHVAFGVEPDHTLWVSDNYSTNGVRVTRPGGTTTTCPPGSRVRVAAGDIVTFAGHAMSVTQLVAPIALPAPAATQPSQAEFAPPAA